MATARDCEGNIISPLGSFKYLPIVSTSVSTPSITRTKSVMSHFPITTTTTLTSQTKDKVMSTPVPVTFMSHFPTVTTLHFPSSLVPSTTPNSQSKDKPIKSSPDLKIVLPVKREPVVRRSQPHEIDMAYSPG